jgi:hypothetical protein
VLILFSFCCGELALIFSILGVALCRNPKSRSNALIVFIVSAIRSCISVTAMTVGLYMHAWS